MSKTASDIAGLITEYYPKVRKVFRNLVSIKDIPISMTQLTCLSVVDRQGELTMSELANELSMSNQQLTKVVDALVEFEMVERTFDPSNRRQIFAKITDKGKQTVSCLRQEIDKKLTRALQRVSPDETEEIYRSLANIAKLFGYKE